MKRKVNNKTDNMKRNLKTLVQKNEKNEHNIELEELKAVANEILTKHSRAFKELAK